VQACEALQCEVSLPRELDFFVIDDSDMQEDESRQEVINFTSQLINNANYTQAYPNIELTLTDADDQPALIRLVKPEEYLKTGTVVAAGIGGRAEVRVKLAIHASGTPVAGYRVLLVY
jgi:SOS-response transcriptional repressor LexA